MRGSLAGPKHGSSDGRQAEVALLPVSHSLHLLLPGGVGMEDQVQDKEKFIPLKAALVSW